MRSFERPTSAVPLVCLVLLLSTAAIGPTAAANSDKKRTRGTDADVAAATAEQAPPAGATSEQLEPIAAAADRREYAEAVRLLDELLPDVGNAEQKAQLQALRASLFGRAEYERWLAIDTSAMEAAKRPDLARALELAREAAAGLDAIDIDATGDAADDLRTLRRHVNERALEMELAVESERFYTVAEEGPAEEALTLHGALLERIEKELRAPGGMSATQRAQLETRRRQLRESAGFVWDRIFNDAAMLVRGGNLDKAREALKRVVRECPVEAVLAKAREGLEQMGP